MIRELYYCALLKDDEIRGLLTSYLKSWMFDEDLTRTVFTLLHKAKRYNEAAFKVELSSCMSPTELTSIMSSLSEVITPILGDDRDDAIEKLISFAKEKSLARTISRIRNEGYTEEVWADIKKADGLSVHEDKIYDFTSSDHREKAHKMMFPGGDILKGSIKSSFSLINNSLSMGGYTPGTITMVVARPGLGKTTFMLNEGMACMLQGYKVFHVLLGDMQPFDILVKYLACYHQTNINDVIINYEKYYTPEVEKALSNLRASCHGAYEMEVEGLCSLCTSTKREFDYDMLIVDYDGNIRISEANMYMSWGYTYGRLEKLSKDLRLRTLIGCQSKLPYWMEEVLPLDSASESSKKQHVVDMMVTLGNSHRNGNVGTMHIAKMRRGEDGGTMRVLYGNKKAKIIEINEEMYQAELKKLDMVTKTFKPS